MVTVSHTQSSHPRECICQCAIACACDLQSVQLGKATSYNNSNSCLDRSVTSSVMVNQTELQVIRIACLASLSLDLCVVVVLGGGGIDCDGTSVTKLKLLEFRHDMYIYDCNNVRHV